MRSNLTLFVFLFVLSSLHAQFSFETVISPEEEILLPFPIENENDYVLFGASGIVADMNPTVVRMSKSGEIINEKIFYKQDTSAYFYHSFKKSNGNYFVIGQMSDSVTPKKEDFTYLCELTPDLHIVWEKYYRLPFVSIYSNHDIKNFMLIPDSTIIINGAIDTLQYSLTRMLFLAKYNLHGEQLLFKSYDWWTEHSIGGGSTLILTSDCTGFFLIGNLDLNYSPKDWIRFDFDLNIQSYGEMENQLSYFQTPSTTKRLSNGNFIICGCTFGMGATHDTELRIMDEDFNLIRDTLLVHDEYVYTPDFQGIDFIDENNIWLSTFEDTPTIFTGDEVYRIFILDSELQVKGMKVFGGKTRYWFRNLLATSDGGCLITGRIPKYEGAMTVDSYVVKVMTDDILTSVQETEMLQNQPLVYPNPFGDYLHIKNKTPGFDHTICDQTGRTVVSGSTSECYVILNTSILKPGIYFYMISNGGRIIENGKIIKQ